MMFRYLLLLPAIGLLSACSIFSAPSDDNVEQPAPLVEFEPSIEVVNLWSADIGNGTDEEYLQLTPAIGEQRVFAVDTNGNVMALDIEDGGRLWSRRIRARITGGVGYGSGLVMVGTVEGEVIALAADDGREVWRTTLTSEVLSPPQLSGNTVVTRTNDGKLYGINASNGAQTWTYVRAVPSLTLRGTGTPVITNASAVICGFDNGRVAALEIESGRLLWEQRVAVSQGSSELEAMVDIDSAPAIIDGMVYIATFQGQLSAFQMETGQLAWNRQISSYAGITADSDSVFVTNDDSHVRAYDRFTGTMLWEQDDLHARAATAPGSIDDFVVVGDLEGYLHWMNKSDGSFTARTRLTEERIITAPVTNGNVIYAYATDGTLGAYTYRRLTTAAQ